MNVRVSIAPFVLALVVLGVACKHREPEGRQRRIEYMRALAEKYDAGPAWALTGNREVRFEDGWYAIEHEPEGSIQGKSWRWMGRNSVTRLQSHGAVAMRLKVSGRAANDIVGTNPVVTIFIDGQRIDSFVALPGWFTRDLVVPAAMLARATWVDLGIRTSASGQIGTDIRELGLMLTDLTWEPVRDGAP